MENNPAFIRYVCRAKKAELDGETGVAAGHIVVAEQLTDSADDLSQLRGWLNRLNAAEGAAQATEHKPARQRKPRRTAQGK